MKNKIAALLLALFLAVTCLTAGAESAVMADILRSIDYGDQITYVIGHKTPDSDTIGSSIAYAWLLQQLGINAKAAATAEVNQETRYALDAYGMEQPEILNSAEGKQFVLVDHSEYSQALDGMRNARVVGIVDHHGIGDVRNTEFIAVISLPVGSTASIVYQLYQDCNVSIPRDMARVMLMSILSDTGGMNGKTVTALDLEAYSQLLPIAEMDDIDAFYAGMKAARMSYDGKTPSEIFYNDYKEYLAGEYTFGIGIVEADTEENLRKLVKKMEAELPAIYASNYLDMLFCMLCTENMTQIIWIGEDAEKAVQESFPDYDGSGSLTYTTRVSRKVHIVPPLTETLEKWTGAGILNAADSEE